MPVVTARAPFSLSAYSNRSLIMQPIYGLAAVALELKKGDRVLFGKWSGTEVKIDGAEILIMKESDVMGVLAK
jgi:hypothetical protein